MLRAFLIGLACLAAIVAGGFTLQAAALGHPDAGRLKVVRTLQSLTKYHASTATIEFRGVRMSARCVQHWYARTRSAAVVLDGWRVISEVGNRLRQTGAAAQSEFALAGCPRPLEVWLSSALAQNEPVLTRLASLGGRRLVELELPAAKPPVDVFVARRTGVPVGLRLAGRRLRGTSSVDYAAQR